MSLQEIYALFLLGMIHGGLAFWAYNDIKLRQRSILWVLGILIIPEAFFPLYFWNQTPELSWNCPRCRRNNRAWSRKCGRCNQVYTAEETVARLHGYFEPFDPVVILLITLLIQELARYIAIMISDGADAMATGEMPPLSAPHFWIVKLVIGNVLIWLCFHCITIRYRRTIGSVGLKYNGNISNLATPLIVAPALILILEGFSQGISGLNRLISAKWLAGLVQWERQENLVGFPEQWDVGLILIAGFVTVILLPVGEEVLFRGIGYIAFADRFGQEKGILLSALFFAVLHGGIRYFSPPILTSIPLFIMGLVLAWLYIRTRSLLPCILTHSLVNLISLTMSFVGK